MWVAFACGSAFFAGITAILAKCGIRETDSTVATAIRTIVVLAFAWVMVAVVGSSGQIGSITPMTWAFLGLSGLATGASWLCYFKALQSGDVNKVVPIDKSSTVLTTGGSWLVFAVLSAVFASLTAILGKVGIEGVESNLGTAVRTIVVLVMSWVMVGVTGKAGAVRAVPRRELLFICLSGLATGASWLCYYKALQDGLASVVVPIDKLSILVTIAFSHLVFGERLTARSGAGLALIVAGTLLMVFMR